MKQIVIRHDVDFSDRFHEQGVDLSFEFARSISQTKSALRESNILITNPHHWNNEYLDSMSAGDWVQTTSTGYAAFPLDKMSERGIHLTNALGNYSIPVAEHVFAMMLGLTRRLRMFDKNQRMEYWDRIDGENLQELHNMNMTIVGLGDIGAAIARRALAFDMNVQAIKKNPDSDYHPLKRTSVHKLDELDLLLPETDVLVLVVPLNDSTYHLLNKQRLELLPDTAMVINVARGPVIEQSSIEQALASGKIAYAGLDVFDPEPLPANSPLWNMENVILTPHVAGRSDQFIPRFMDLFLENYSRYESGTKLKNQLV
jgi:D-2-hydroxyacid dehydrogenase (NADP+)